MRLKGFSNTCKGMENALLLEKGRRATNFAHSFRGQRTGELFLKMCMTEKKLYLLLMKMERGRHSG